MLLLAPDKTDDDVFIIGERDSTKSPSRGIGNMSIAVRKSRTNSSLQVDSA